MKRATQEGLGVQLEPRNPRQGGKKGFQIRHDSLSISSFENEHHICYHVTNLLSLVSLFFSGWSRDARRSKNMADSEICSGKG